MSKSVKEKKIFSKLFPPPKFLKMPFAGLTISDSFVRFVEFKESKKGLVLSSFGKKSLPQGIVDRGYVHNKEQLVGILKELKEEYTGVKLTIKADLNPGMKMIASKPIRDFLDKLVKGMEEFDDWSNITE